MPIERATMKIVSRESAIVVAMLAISCAAVAELAFAKTRLSQVTVLNLSHTTATTAIGFSGGGDIVTTKARPVFSVAFRDNDGHVRTISCEPDDWGDLKNGDNATLIETVGGVSGLVLKTTVAR